MKMEQKLHRLLTKAGRYKYALLILLLGVGLMLIPQKAETEPERPVEQKTEENTVLEERLERILREMDGVGEAKVLLTLATGTSYQYQTDVLTHTRQDDAEVQKETVLASDGNGKQIPIAVRTTYPTYQGALVICQGADRSAVKLNVINAVSDVTGLGSDKISVIKMKEQ